MRTFCRALNDHLFQTTVVAFAGAANVRVTA